MVTVGNKAPDFLAPAVSAREAAMLELFDHVESHQAVVLVFEPADFVPASTAELLAIQQAGWTEHEELSVICLTGDSLYSHAAYADQYNFSFPLVSDFHGSIADSYDVLRDEWEGHTHIPGRAAIVIDETWEIQAIQKAESPLELTANAPPIAVTESIRDLGVPVEEPEIQPE